jgi:hypothetical protein
MGTKYDLDKLMADPYKPLTREQYENFDKYMAMTNDDKPASEVDLTDAVEELIEEMDVKGVCWWL